MATTGKYNWSILASASLGRDGVIQVQESGRYHCLKVDLTGTEAVYIPLADPHVAAMVAVVERIAAGITITDGREKD